MKKKIIISTRKKTKSTPKKKLVKKPLTPKKNVIHREYGFTEVLPAQITISMKDYLALLDKNYKHQLNIPEAKPKTKMKKPTNKKKLKK